MIYPVNLDCIVGYQEVLDLQLALAAEECGEPLDPATLARGMGRALMGNAQYFAKIVDTEVVGCARTQVTISDWHNKQRILIDGVYVLPDYRRRGFARELIQHILQQYPDADYELNVKQTNAAARALYASLGFIDTGYITLSRNTP